MPWSLQLPDGTVVLSNRFGRGPFDDCQAFVRAQLPQVVEIEGVYNAARGATPQRYRLYAFAIWRGILCALRTLPTVLVERFRLGAIPDATPRHNVGRRNSSVWLRQLGCLPPLILENGL